ncbi:LysR family transcriptional regulator [Celeribacter persicus]|uniref:DNA-binding transcriptional LysR family regulator n=1 Tax=Celeribacter persicus TaxID=1651082 RepID=A0A2T5H4F9_9RHOB|nr:LysR family transcriptional regulator [Celeribacter persicus]PTQ66462.1 DNA-binding transcriptional LysR family regulator [Celeribacter persicus]
MRSSTIILADLALRHGGVRAASRASGQPVSSIGASLTRLEDDLGFPLVRRGEDGISLTIDAQRRAPAIARLAALCRQILTCEADLVPDTSISFAALFRLAEALRVGSIRRAAEQMNLAQPQLTRQISLLERTLDTTLILRGPKGIDPTPEGLRLVNLTGQLEAEWRALSRVSEPQHSQVSRRYSLGSIIPATPFGELATLLAGLNTEMHNRQGLRVSIASTLAEDLLMGLDTGRFDCILLDAALNDPTYAQTPVLRGGVAMAGLNLPKDYRDEEGLRAALRRQPLALQSRRSGLRQLAERFFDTYAGPDWRNLTSLVEIDSLPIIVNMAHSGAANSILPRHATTQDIHNIMPLPDSFDQIIYLTWRRTPKGRRLAQLIRSNLTKLQDRFTHPSPA